MQDHNNYNLMYKMKLILFFSFTVISFSIYAQGALKVFDKSKNACGVFSLKGEEIVTADLDKITYVNQSFHCVKNNIEGIIAMDGTLVVSVEFDSLSYNNCSQPKLYAAYKDQQWMVYGAKGEVLAELNYDRVSAPL